MEADHWYQIASRLGNGAVHEIDDIIGLQNNPKVRDQIACAQFGREPYGLPEALWDFREDDLVSIGIRVTEALSDSTHLAAHLVAIAAERGINPVILSAVDLCGLERFGLRVENIAERPGVISSELENQIKAFWHITVVVDAERVLQMS